MPIREKIFESAPHGQYSVRLYQTGADSFDVEYGLQVKRDLNYERAATELGQCLMHQLGCDGKLMDESDEDEDAPIRQTACKHCGADIEGEVGGTDWRDRGNCSGCSEWGPAHEPVRD